MKKGFFNEKALMRKMQCKDSLRVKLTTTYNFLYNYTYSMQYFVLCFFRSKACEKSARYLNCVFKEVIGFLKLLCNKKCKVTAQNLFLELTIKIGRTADVLQVQSLQCLQAPKESFKKLCFGP